MGVSQVAYDDRPNELSPLPVPLDTAVFVISCFCVYFRRSNKVDGRHYVYDHILSSLCPLLVENEGGKIVLRLYTVGENGHAHTHPTPTPAGMVFHEVFGGHSKAREGEGVD